MEDESGLDSPSDDTRWLSFAELADELCPQYMSIGVPYHEYWHGDYTQLAHYREAFELQRERSNYDAWLQGAYFYDALCMVSPILHAFAKKGAKPTAYHKKPYGTKTDGSSTKTAEQASTRASEEIQAINASARFASFMTQWNKRFEEKGGEADGSND